MIDLEGLEKLLAEGTAGPWAMETGISPLGDTGDFDGWVEIIGGSTTVALWQAEEDGDEANAALIAAAVNALPELIAMARRAEELESLLSHMLATDQRRTRGEPQILDIAYTAFMRAKGKNDEDGGPTDWMTDTRPMIAEGLDKLARAALNQEAKP